MRELRRIEEVSCMRWVREDPTARPKESASAMQRLRRKRTLPSVQRVRRTARSLGGGDLEKVLELSRAGCDRFECFLARIPTTMGSAPRPKPAVSTIGAPRFLTIVSTR